VGADRSDAEFIPPPRFSRMPPSIGATGRRMLFAALQSPDSAGTLAATEKGLPRWK
jgi:hypothetical protein